MKIFTANQIAEIDRATLNKQSLTEYDIISRVAKELATWLKSNYLKRKQKVVIFAGEGNNGNDAISLSSKLGVRDFDCDLYIVKTGIKTSTTRKQLIEELYVFGSVRIKEIKSESDIPDIAVDSLVIDGLFGTGLTRTVDGIYSKVIHAINTSYAKVVSIDLPSGILADNRVDDNDFVIVKANCTLTLEFPKLCMFFKENYKYVGDWHILNIGLDAEIRERLTTPYGMIIDDTVRRFLRKRGKYSHKGDYGHGLLVAGSFGMGGAAVLAARGALRAGLGLITAHIPNRLYNIVQITVPEAICNIDQSENLFTSCSNCDFDSYDVVAVGPGLGKAPETVNALKELLEKCDKPMVIDADAINIIASHKELISLIPRNSVLTPHPKEFERLVGSSRDSLDAFTKQRDFSVNNLVTVVLKGANTTVSTPDGNLWFNTTGNPGMATAGSGDVLCGVIMGLMAQGYPAKEAAITGVYIHSLSGDIVAAKYGEASLIASDIIDHLGEAFDLVLKKSVI